MAGRFYFGFWCWWALANLARFGRVCVKCIIIAAGVLLIHHHRVFGAGGCLQIWHGVGGFETSSSSPVIRLVFVAASPNGTIALITAQQIALVAHW